MIAYLIREVNGLALTDLSRRIKREISSLREDAERILNCSKEEGELGKRKKILDKELLQIP